MPLALKKLLIAKRSEIVVAITVIAGAVILKKRLPVEGNDCVLALLLAGIFVASGGEIKSEMLVFASLFYMHEYMGIADIQITVLVVSLSVFYMILAQADYQKASIKNRTCLMMFIVVFIVFVLHKMGQSQPHAGSFGWWMGMVGLSYLGLKVISFLAMHYSGLQREKSWLSFLSYCFYVPTFVAGPLFDYEDYYEQLSDPFLLNDRIDAVLCGVKRIIVGLFKTRVLSSLTSNFTFYAVSDEVLLSHPLSHLLGLTYMTMFDLYFNFSGYTDLAIGLSKCIGLRVPENFDYPFVSQNLQDFWKRWHISLSNWLKKYIYLPLHKVLLEKDLFPPSLAGPIAIMVTFTLMGLWHGFQINYILYGVIHGVGLFVVTLWTSSMKKSLLYKKYSNMWGVQLISCLVTVHYFALSLLVFFADTGHKWNLLTLVVRRVLHA